jgi:hypothetical protein
MISGRCACGAVQFEVDGDIEDFSHCHCSICRRLHGGAYASFAGVQRERFRYLRGEDSITTYTSSPGNERVFCSICGSTILCDPQTEPSRLYLSMSAVDGDPPLPAGYHQYIGSKAPWHAITDDLRRYETSVAAG